ncbi:polysaccharide deacetylase family protein [Paenibacillus piri]|uniref:Polysaccharide deacetylase family protein n=1 Tax=Paenibacillus piri TaxID=2547395 RepID=A0A4R5KUB9_9BACL|nr:polysaccharide deacetylase family protein [Paenibacillus piri]TDF99316.1 polysaccharide deacetylase family protein [Paenibacillus piri]
MNKTMLALLSAALLTTAAACQNNSNAQPAAVQLQTAPVQQPASGDAAKTPEQSQTAGAGKAAEPAPAKPAGDAGGAAPTTVPTPAQPEKTALQPAAKLYKMNPKTYDIVPIDPAAASKNVVLLTFDDGPRNKEVLASILDTLDKHKAKAIFFVNGYLVKQKPELLKLIQERGHAIGNHSWDHIDLKKESKDKVDQQIGDVQKIVKEVTGSAPQFFRPPFGSGSDDVRAKAKQENMLYMTWSNGSLDWEMTVKKNDPNKVVSNVLGQLRGGSNILMHELPWTAQALDPLLTQLEEKQFGFVDPHLIDINQ